MQQTKTSLKQSAYRSILNLILGGEASPGDLLNRRGMAAKLEMSLAPVHEAMLTLERDGFLEALPRRGTRVRTASRQDIHGHLVLREALECQAGRRICSDRCRADSLASLMPMAVEADGGESAATDRVHAEIEFHIALVHAAACPILEREYKKVMRLGLFYRINQFLPMPPAAPERRHRDLLDSLMSATPQQAEDSIREHVWSGKPEEIQPDSA